MPSGNPEVVLTFQHRSGRTSSSVYIQHFATQPKMLKACFTSPSGRSSTVVFGHKIYP